MRSLICMPEQFNMQLIVINERSESGVYAPGTTLDVKD